MRLVRSVFRLVLCVVLLGAGASAFAQTPTKPPIPKTLTELDAAIEAARREAAIPGMSVAVIENGQIVLTKGYGFADVAAKTPVTIDTLFRAGSISKAFAGIGAMILVEEGKLALDRPLAELAPEVPVNNPWATDHPIRLVHLLEHTSGWSDYTIKQFSADGRGLSLADAVVKDGPYAVRYPPGRYFAYSNPGAAAAALMVERAAGEPFDDFIWSRIFKPLGMASATYDPPSQGLAKSYRRDGATPAAYMHLSAPSIGGLNITAKDLAQYPLLMLGRGTLNGVRIVSPESVDRIERSESARSAQLGLTTGYGLANQAAPSDKAVFRGHDGGIDGAAAQAAYWPGHGAGYVLMWTKQVPNPAAERIRDYLTRDAPTPVASAAPIEDSDLAALAGVYEPVAMRQPLAAPIEALFNLATVEVKAGSLTITGEAFRHVGGKRFQREGRPVPTAVFASEGREHFLYVSTSTFRRMSKEAVAARIAWAAAFGALSLFAIFNLLGALWSWLRGRLRDRGGLGLRILPAMAVGSVWALLGLAILVFGLDNSVLIPALGSQSQWSLGLFAASAMIPILGFLSFWRALTAGYGASAFIRFYGMAAGIVTVAAAAFLHGYGWLGLATWVR